MDQSGSSEAPSWTSTTGNPIAAVGRKVKSVLSSSNQPSIRIFRDSSAHGKSRRKLTTSEKRSATGPQASNLSSATPEGKGNSFANRFRSRFRHDDSDTDEWHEHEYDQETVDLLDVVGMYSETKSKKEGLTICRSRSIYSIHSYQCSEFPLRPFLGKIPQSSTYV